MASPRIAGAVAVLAAVAAVTVAALPSGEPASTPQAVTAGAATAAVLQPEVSSLTPGLIPMHRVTATLGDGAEAARKRATAVAKTLRIPARTARTARTADR